MGKRFDHISKEQQLFIEKQKMFFVATAASEGRVNLSPKGMDSFRVLGENKVIWLNVTGSGNETATHVLENPRMTIMFCAFEGKPMILRLYGQAKVYHPRDPEWQEFITCFPENHGSRQIFELEVDLVQTSCGFGVPFYDYVDERGQLNDWAEKIGPEGVKEYWKKKNQTSLDGHPTHIL